MTDRVAILQVAFGTCAGCCIESCPWAALLFFVYLRCRVVVCLVLFLFRVSQFWLFSRYLSLSPLRINFGSCLEYSISFPLFIISYHILFRLFMCGCFISNTRYLFSCPFFVVSLFSYLFLVACLLVFYFVFFFANVLGLLPR